MDQNSGFGTSASFANRCDGAGEERGSSSIYLTCAFMPDSVSLVVHSLTVAGFEWGCCCPTVPSA
ncbi:hypothetical protein BDM02DRAFT_1845415 [Thelephora ganbajun]|uniref:Uncharacterized protein n=1 Tax=Thelephora ganbajun TaxID=370292 RepID=A0ACB6ZIF5_THEGA|nr:hypothetical protein BDM02DRAFT_1845415 [Thelephora ganbajun]